MELLSPDVIKAVLSSGAVIAAGRGLLKWSKERSARVFTASSKVYRSVNNCVKETLTETMARRVSIREIHNGGVWLSNHPIYRLTMTHEHARVGVDPISSHIKEQITTGAVMKLLIDLDRNKTKYIPDLELEPDPELRGELSRFGAKSVWLCMLKNKKNRPLGVFCAAFDKPNYLSGQDFETLIRKVHHIEEIMQ